MSRLKKKDLTSAQGFMHNIIVGAENNDFKEVDLAIAEDSNAIVYQDPQTGMTAFHVAAGDGNLGMANHLASKPGFDLRITDKFGRDALDLAIAVGHAGITELYSRHLYPKSFSGDSEGPQGPRLVTP